MKVKIKKLTKNAIIPSYAHESDAGLDLTATDYHYDASSDSFIYHTGLAIEVPAGYVALLFPRSSNKNTNCYLANSVGVVDSGYRGEILLAFKGRDRNVLNKPYNVGDRVAQMIIMPYPKIELEETEELSETDRSIGGFGSTGK